MLNRLFIVMALKCHKEFQGIFFAATYSVIEVKTCTYFVRRHTHTRQLDYLPLLRSCAAQGNKVQQAHHLWTYCIRTNSICNNWTRPHGSVTNDWLITIITHGHPNIVSTLRTVKRVQRYQLSPGFIRKGGRYPPLFFTDIESSNANWIHGQ